MVWLLFSFLIVLLILDLSYIIYGNEKSRKMNVTTLICLILLTNKEIIMTVFLILLGVFLGIPVIISVLLGISENPRVKTPLELKQEAIVNRLINDLNDNSLWDFEIGKLSHKTETVFFKYCSSGSDAFCTYTFPASWTLYGAGMELREFDKYSSVYARCEQITKEHLVRERHLKLDGLSDSLN